MSILHRTLLQSRKGLAPRRIPTPGEGSHIMWYRIDMQDRECSTATLETGNGTRIPPPAWLCIHR